MRKDARACANLQWYLLSPLNPIQIEKLEVQCWSDSTHVIKEVITDLWQYKQVKV